MDKRAALQATLGCIAQLSFIAAFGALVWVIVTFQWLGILGFAGVASAAWMWVIWYNDYKRQNERDNHHA